MIQKLRRRIQSPGLALFRQAEPPTRSSFEALRAHGVEVEPIPEAEDVSGTAWALMLRHPAWGAALVVRHPDVVLPDAITISIDPGMTQAEKRAVFTARSALGVTVEGTREDVLRDRKDLLRWLRLVLGKEGLGGFDCGPEMTWSPAALDEELAHDAPLDVSALYNVHAVCREGQSLPVWVHTHGLASVGGFDFDVLRPSHDMFRSGVDPFRALAFDILEETVRCDSPCHEIASPDGYVALVPVADFMRDAHPRDRGLRDAPEAHAHDRSVVCDPRDEHPEDPPRPAALFSSRALRDFGFFASNELSRIAAERARKTLPGFHALCEEFRDVGVKALVRIPFTRDGAGPGFTEHLWFAVHRWRGDEVDATLVDEPRHVAALRKGERAWRPLDGLSDWKIVTPFGEMTPHSSRLTRRIREKRESMGRIGKPLCRPSRTRPGGGRWLCST